MDSRFVNRYIRSEIWPALRDCGFEVSKPRVAWREHADRIDTLAFRTLNAYDAGLFRLKPGSFWIEQSCHLKYITNPIAVGTGTTENLREPMPEDCLLRNSIRRRYHGRKDLDRHYWPMGVPDRSPEKIMEEARRSILGKGLEWFDQFDTPAAVYRLLVNRDGRWGNVWGFGTPTSPVRCYMLGYAALAANRRRLARKHLRAALNTAQFPGHAARMRADAGIA